MSIAEDKIAVTCPQCEQQLLIPSLSVGKQGRCPSCKHIFPLAASIPTDVFAPPPTLPSSPSLSPPSPTKSWQPEAVGSYTPQPLPAMSSLPANPYPPPTPYAPATGHVPPTAQANKARYQHGFGWEHRGWDSGMTGGLAMMAIAALWFFGGLACGLVFYYPPILFIIGLVGFFRGLFTGNVTGR
jgi:hypothetical protein